MLGRPLVHGVTGWQQVGLTQLTGDAAPRLREPSCFLSPRGAAATEHGFRLVLTRLPWYYSAWLRVPFMESWSLFGNQVNSKYAALFNPPPEHNFRR